MALCFFGLIASVIKKKSVGTDDPGHEKTERNEEMNTGKVGMKDF